MELQTNKIPQNKQNILYGDYPIFKPSQQQKKLSVQLKNINQSFQRKQILIRVRIYILRSKGNSAFLILRQSLITIQAFIFKNNIITKQMIKFINNIPLQSIVDIIGIVVKPQRTIQYCSIKVQIQIMKIFVISRAIIHLPLPIRNASEQENINNNFIRMKNRLDYRILDLRTMAKQSIFIISSAFCQYLREILIYNDFIQIHTPKIINNNFIKFHQFQINYFDKKAYLTESTQFYHQICIMGDFQRIFQIAPIFKQTNCTHRHLCQYTSIDITMTIKQQYFEIFDLFDQIFTYIFTKIQKLYSQQLKAFNNQFKFQQFKYKYPIIKITFQEGIALLKQNNIEWNIFDDFDIVTQKKLGQLIQNKFNTNLYIIHRYPKIVSQFNTMICYDNQNYVCSYRLFMRGEKVLSGAQKIHDPEILIKRLRQNQININNFKDYINNFEYGAFPYCNSKMGLERIIMLYFGLNNIRNCSLFPRDSHRITP